MKNSVALTVTSLLSALFFMTHVADDMARGLDSVGPQNVIGVLILGVWAFTGWRLAGHKAGQILLLVLSLLSIGVFVLHMSGSGAPKTVRSPGGFFFVWTLYALASTAFLSAVFCVQALWPSRRTQPRESAVQASGVRA